MGYIVVVSEYHQGYLVWFKIVRIASAVVKLTNTPSSPSRHLHEKSESDFDVTVRYRCYG